MADEREQVEAGQVQEHGDQPFEVGDEPELTGLPAVPEQVTAGGGKEGGEKEGPSLANITLPEAEQRGAPPWVLIPPGMKFPRGRQVLFLKFRSSWTDAPWKGDELPGLEGKWRQCICWGISVGDKKLALGRAQSDPNRIADELTKQMIRAVDGKQVKWDGLPEGSLDEWWTEVGERVRLLINKIFLQLHTMKREELQDFFENCIAVRSSG